MKDLDLSQILVDTDIDDEEKEEISNMSDEELNNFIRVENWYKGRTKPIFIISGYAGCGKTTFARKIPNRLKIFNTAYLAPTGKAAKVLHENARTIHSYLYNVEKDKKTGQLIFYKKSKEEFIERLLIIDEISMVNQDLLNDLLSLNIPIIGLGDPAQLPPVNGTNKILDNPDIFLTRVWRNDGGLLDYATDIRMHNTVKKDYENVDFRRNNFVIDVKKLDDNSVVICRFNKTRNALNNLIRKEVYGYEKVLEVGEKLMILNNNKETGLMNGSVVTLKDITFFNQTLNFIEAIVENEDGFTQSVKLNLYIILGVNSRLSRNILSTGNYHDVDYAYAITCHKAQGSEYENVFVINEGSYFEDHDKWLYTAVTRARKKLYMYKG